MEPPLSKLTSGPGTPLPSWLACFLVAGAVGCSTVAPLPPVDLEAPGWTARQGQAVWKRQASAPGIAGEILIASGPEHRALVQFSKNPFPLVVAQSTSRSWEVRLPTENKRYSGHGKPPGRLIFLSLPRALAGGPPPQGWSSEKIEENHWRFRNRTTGESLELYLNP